MEIALAVGRTRLGRCTRRSGAVIRAVLGWITVTRARIMICIYPPSFRREVGRQLLGDVQRRGIFTCEQDSRDGPGTSTAPLGPQVSPLSRIYERETLALRLTALVLSLTVFSVLILLAAGIYALMSFTEDMQGTGMESGKRKIGS